MVEGLSKVYGSLSDVMHFFTIFNFCSSSSTLIVSNSIFMESSYFTNSSVPCKNSCFCLLHGVDGDTSS